MSKPEPEPTQQKDTSKSSSKSQNTTTTKSTTTKPSVNATNIHNNIHSDKNNNNINHIQPNNTKDEKSMDENEQLNGYNNNNNDDESKQANPIELTINLDIITEKYLRQTQEIYYSQCPSLRANEAKQYDLFTLAAIGRSNNNYPLLLNLIDCYLRAKFKYFLQHPKNTTQSISPQDWCNKNKIVKKLISKSKLNSQKKERLKDIIQSAIRTYFRRYCQPLLLPTPYQIRDSIQKFVKCIHEIGGLIAAIKQNPIEILPFQIDLVIIPQNVIDTANEENESNSDTANEENSDTFEESDSDSDDVTTSEDDIMPVPGTNRWCAEIGNIKNRLEYNNIKYSYGKKIKFEREFRNLYRQYTQKINVPNIKNKKELVDNIGTDLQRFPHRKRLCIVVDRRIKENENKDNDNDNENENKNNNDEMNEIFLFEPPLSNELPNNHIREWYIESSYKCIIPGYKKQAITSKSSLDGWINVFSFHIEQEDEIRCYFYRGGGILRFMPNDIKDLFQYLFDLKKFNNSQFINGNVGSIQNDIQRMKNTWRDVHFDKFREMLT